MQTEQNDKLQQLPDMYQMRLHNVIEDVHRTTNYYNGVATSYAKIVHGTNSELLMYRLATESHNSRLDWLVKMLTAGQEDKEELREHYKRHNQEWEEMTKEGLLQYYGGAQNTEDHSREVREGLVLEPPPYDESLEKTPESLKQTPTAPDFSSAT